MKRKTNLFYTEGPDSKFLTFSNYAESLTGNFLSVDTKIFPSRFLCMNINNLNSNTKKKFIEYLVAYYENKLAILRDNSKNIENDICPLAYLIEALAKVLHINNSTGFYELQNSTVSDHLKINDDYDITKISFLSSEITEQDYNGIYTDTICNIDLNSIKTCNVSLIDELTNYEEESIIDESESLYGWENVQEVPGYENITPVYDAGNRYIVNSKIKALELKDLDDSVENIKFNVIIPLYEITDININTNNTVLGYDEYNEENKTYIINLNNDNKYRHNVPLGIWINADKEYDSPIEIDKDLTTGISPIWSLMISSQFKPFPYSTKYEIEGIKSNKGAAFATFSQVLLRLNKVLDAFEKTNNRITNVEKRLDEIQTVINNMGTIKSIDNLVSKMNSLENDVNDKVNQFKEEIKEMVANLKWKYQ